MLGARPPSEKYPLGLGSCCRCLSGDNGREVLLQGCEVESGWGGSNFCVDPIIAENREHFIGIGIVKLPAHGFQGTPSDDIQVALVVGDGRDAVSVVGIGRGISNGALRRTTQGVLRKSVPGATAKSGRATPI